MTTGNSAGKRLRTTLIVGAVTLAIAVGLVVLIASTVIFGAGERDLFLRVPPGHVAIMTRKSGRELPSGAILAPRTRPGEDPYRGVQENVLTPGRYTFAYSSLFWDWEIVPQTHVPADHVGVLVRLFGEDLPPGQSLADESKADEANGILRKGVLAQTLAPGYHLINTRAYDVILYPMVTIDPGQVGVVTRQYGAQPRDASAFLSDPGERGVQKTVLPPGSHYLNPYVDSVLAVSRQSQRLDLAEQGAVLFPTNDGFDAELAGNVEWSIAEKNVPLVYVKFGATQHVGRILILPAARAISRLQGSRKPAREFISGASRQTFHDDFARELRATVEAEGLTVHSVTISGIETPDEIRQPIMQRETSLLEREQFQVQMETERSRVDLARQLELEKRPQLISNARKASLEIVTQAKQVRESRLIEAQRDLDVSVFERDASAKQAEARVSVGAAQAEVQRMLLQAEAEALTRRIEAFGGGAAFGKLVLYEKLAPRYASILANTDGPLSEAFREISSSRAEPKPKPTTSKSEARGQ